LAERESAWIPTLAAEMLVQPPLALLVSWITRLKPSGDGSHFSDVIAFHLPHINYSHIGEPLVAFLAGEKRRLATINSRHIDALGLSAIVPVASLLARHVNVDRLQTFRQALDAGATRKASAPTDLGVGTGLEHRYLDRAGTSAIAAVAALRRLGKSVETDRVIDWLRQLDGLFAPDSEDFTYRASCHALRWVLFEQGDDSQFDWFLTHYLGDFRHDVAMTLLRRGDTLRFEQWLGVVPEKYPQFVHPPHHVHYWPLIDHLQSRGIGPLHGQSDGYMLARAAERAAPHGWVWQCMPDDA
jgi:hypothetical protein